MSLASLFSRWFRRARPARADLHFVVYTRVQCHLCDEAWTVLEQLQRRYRFPLEARDVDAAPDLMAQYGTWVPVITVNGKVRFRGGVNKVLALRILERE